MLKIYTTYQFTYFIGGIIQGMIKNPKIKEIQQVQQKIYTKQVSMLKITCCYVIFHLNLKRLGFTGEPDSTDMSVPREHDARENVKEFVVMSPHIMPRRIVSGFTLQP